MNSTNDEFSPGTIAITKHAGSIILSHFMRREASEAAPFTSAITPDIENSGRNSATLLHLESAFSNISVLAGTSPGKNIASRISPYRWFLL